MIFIELNCDLDLIDHSTAFNRPQHRNRPPLIDRSIAIDRL
jgi:hypothetical protein